MKLVYEGIQEFLTHGIVVSDLLLPMHYAKFDRLDEFQAGFRTHGNTEETWYPKLTGDGVPTGMSSP